jgi:hypothetical protein
MKNKIVWILKLENEHTFLGLGFMRRKLVYYEDDKIQQVSLSDAVGKFFVITELARSWKISAVSDEHALRLWTTSIQCELPSRNPFLLTADDARGFAPALNPKRKRKVFSYFSPTPKMFQLN